MRKNKPCHLMHSSHIAEKGRNVLNASQSITKLQLDKFTDEPKPGTSKE